MHFSAVHAALAGLRECRTGIDIGMDMVTDIAMDLVDAPEGEDRQGIKKMEAMMVEFAKLDREINTFVDTVEQAIAEVHQQPPEAICQLSARVKEDFAEKVDVLSDAELLQHKKVLALKDVIESSSSQESAVNGEEVDEDITVTQSQVNFNCPLTQMEMVNPVKNKKCNHHYDETSILSLIKARKRQQKKCSCPVVGCVNRDVKKSDLVLDPIVKRMIQNQKGRGNKK
ncbi:E3 SUMO-protein ligase NSE2 [Lampris incognitus]|uniref:E3 SUMO-protein ligase NSE2 n=1 Tax=Lampris incognitus TaxID=2546036 RepID=UPI0024B50CEC|nr:E3 SUMO-protein ligase NSE2 [Lampris incognitus]